MGPLHLHPFVALIRVNTVIQAVVGNGNRGIRGETRAEYQGRQEGQKAHRNKRNSPESKHSDQTEKDETAQKCQPGQYFAMSVCVCV